MSLSIGIVGLPNVGKSTLFNALTQKSVPAENYPFCTIDPSVGVVAVPDLRLKTLSDFSNSAKTIPAVVEFVDIAGLVRGAAEGEGLGNQFLAHIREVDVIVQLVRFFDDANMHHVHGDVDPLSDIETINLELIFADIETVQKRLSTLEHDIKRGDKKATEEQDICERIRQTLEAGNFALSVNISESEISTLESLHLLTAKKMLYVLNKKAGGYNLDELNDGRAERCLEYLKKHNYPFIYVDVGIEGELNEMSPEDKSAFRQELGAQSDGVDELIRKGYEMLDLITFFTTGEDETRGWTTARGATAPKAGATIHSDFKDKFIKADVISYNELLNAGSYAMAREKGLLRTEGKKYIVKDGDVIEFRI